MTTQFTTSLGPVPLFTQRKNTVRVALFDLSQPSSSLLTDCFRQSGMEATPIPDSQKERLHREKFDACVLSLGESVGGIIELARNSASNSRIVIYGLGGTAQDALRYSKYCINAVFPEPLERSAVMKLMRSTRPLVLHEFRRYVRVPVMTDVAVVAADGSRLSVTSQDISTGGMSLKGTAHLEPGQLVEVSFALLTLPRIHVRGYVTWKKPNKTVGVRFDASDERRRRLKDWIGGYLEA
jgi:hypothetical protein